MHREPGADIKLGGRVGVKVQQEYSRAGARQYGKEWRDEIDKTEEVLDS